MAHLIDPTISDYATVKRETRHPDLICQNVLDSLQVQECPEIMPLSKEEKELREKALETSTTSYEQFSLDCDEKFAIFPHLVCYRRNETTGENEIVGLYNMEQKMREYFQNQQEETLIQVSQKLKRSAVQLDV